MTPAQRSAPHVEGLRKPASPARPAGRPRAAAARAGQGIEHRPPQGRRPTNRLVTTVERWAPSLARTLLGAVLAWFGYHELVAPELWTGYVPVLSATSKVAEVMVLAHGWALLLLAVALVAGIAPRLAAAISSLVLLEIVISLTVSSGLSDLVLRDVGVLGLSLSVVGQKSQRLLLTR